MDGKKVERHFIGLLDILHKAPQRQSEIKN